MSNKLKILIFIILVIIILIAVFSVYFLMFSTNNQETPSQNITQKDSLEENILEENTVQNTMQNETSENIVSNTTNTSVTKVNLSNETNNSSAENTNNSEPNINELKKLLESYSVGIQRITYGGENLESNTILLFLAKQYFDSSSSKKSSLKVDTTYASTVKNIHKYLTELIGTNYNNVQSINSYKNYVGYSSGTNSYEYGSDISVLRDEEYECPKLELTEEKNGIYTAKGEVIRIANNVETVYDITLTFQINQNYTYQKYQIISLKSANKSFYPDNTVHLIENTEVE